MADNIRRSRTAIWAVVILVLIFAFMGAWRSVEEEATNTAVVVASKRILERANYYKQQRLLNGSAGIDEFGQPFSYSKSGWLLPLSHAKRDCSFWLSYLYPERRVLGIGQPEVIDMSDKDGIYCRYQYTEKYQIDVLFSQGRFSVKANILAL